MKHFKVLNSCTIMEFLDLWWYIQIMGFCTGADNQIITVDMLYTSSLEVCIAQLDTDRAKICMIDGQQWCNQQWWLQDYKTHLWLLYYITQLKLSNLLLITSPCCCKHIIYAWQPVSSHDFWLTVLLTALSNMSVWPMASTFTRSNSSGVKERGVVT